MHRVLRHRGLSGVAGSIFHQHEFYFQGTVNSSGLVMITLSSARGSGAQAIQPLGESTWEKLLPEELNRQLRGSTSWGEVLS